MTKLQKLYSPPRNLRVTNKSPTLFLKKPLCLGDLSPVCKIFIERSEGLMFMLNYSQTDDAQTEQ